MAIINLKIETKMGCCNSKKAKIESGKVKWTGMSISAQKRTSAKLWTCREFQREMLLCLDDLQRTQLQALNRHCYNLCIKQV